MQVWVPRVPGGASQNPVYGSFNGMASKKNPAAVALGRLGGKKGGKARVPKGISALSPEERRAISLKGVAARRAKAKKKAATKKAGAKKKT
jgi:hypothetical protein